MKTCPFCGLSYKDGQEWKHTLCRPTLPQEKQKLLEEISKEIEKRADPQVQKEPAFTGHEQQEKVDKTKFDRAAVMRERWAKRKAAGKTKL